MPSNVAIVQNPNDHGRILGMCWVIYGLLRLMGGALLFVYSGTATAMFGTLLDRVPNPFILMNVFHFTYGTMIVLSVICGVLGIMAGLGLLAAKQSARALALLAGVLSLCNIPLGTTLGIYTLVALLPGRTARPHGSI